MMYYHDDLLVLSSILYCLHLNLIEWRSSYIYKCRRIPPGNRLAVSWPQGKPLRRKKNRKMEVEDVGNVSTFRNVTTALALQVFIWHSFSFDWIKEITSSKLCVE
jgi:hypothetical protein